MKRVELLCDGCVRPITSVPFYKCSQQHCDFFLHEWCTRLPFEIKDHHNHPQHTLVLMPKILRSLFGLFWCNICLLPCNGFAYGCMQCEYYVDINCGFIPDVITHEAHPNHLLLRFKASSVRKACKACMFTISHVGFHCPSCDFYLHTECALLLPRTIRHRFDKHALRTIIVNTFVRFVRMNLTRDGGSIIAARVPPLCTLLVHL
ncbi:protein VACUOLELESS GAMETOPHYTES-like [Bidens hawaiensis]|uniref:protein VACUOLELESS GAMETOPHYTES-like n=1 Tax=Bidens hawaiensis TaxID=980011 RepID=UPI00404999D2